MSSILSIYDSVDTITEMADFVHALVHKSDRLVPEANVTHIANALGIEVPSSLYGMDIQVTEQDQEPKMRKSVRTVSVIYGDFPGNGGGKGDRLIPMVKRCVTIRGKKGPVSGTVKICADCSISDLNCKIDIDIDIVVGF